MGRHAGIQKVLSEMVQIRHFFMIRGGKIKVPLYKRAFRWRADDGPILNAGLVALRFSGDRTCIAIKPYICCHFRGGGGTGPPVPLRIRAWADKPHCWKSKVTVISPMENTYNYLTLN